MKIKKIQVMSQKNAEALCKEKNKETTGNYAVISIVSPSSHEADIKTGGAIKKLFRMKFYDVEEDFYRPMYIPEKKKYLDVYYPAPSKADMEGLKEFVDTLKDIDVLIVHCAAGISRSAGIAAAIEEYLGMEDTIWCSNKHFPNRQVYKNALEIFGMRKTEDYYADLFTDKG